jgi:preprotein translocase subunit SecA
MTTGVIVADPEVRREQYNADITYGTNNEFGFDYLRDNMAWRKQDLVQRGHFFAIVDEVDSILIDEARTPLIISGPSSGEANRWFAEFAKIADARGRRGLRGRREEAHRRRARARHREGRGLPRHRQPLRVGEHPLISFLNNSIKALALFKRDTDYVVMNDEVMIVDEHTGRILVGRRYNEGIHQAIEAKEGVPVKAENQTLATVTLQNYFRLYDKLAGMTGTAETEAAEFMSTYKLGVVPIPTNKPMIRKDQPDLVYKNETAKFAQVVEDIARGTRTASRCSSAPSASRRASTSRACSQEGHQARGPQREEPRARGRDRRPRRPPRRRHRRHQHGRPWHRHHARRQRRVPRGAGAQGEGLDPVETPEEYEAAWDETYEAKRRGRGGDEGRRGRRLYVLGTERHESRRIDNQLRGRSGRQGDPGESRFYLSLTDDLMRLFQSGAAEAILARTNFPTTSPIESGWSPARSRARRARSRRATPRSARTSSSTTTSSTASARRSTPTAATCSRATTSPTASSTSSRTPSARSSTTTPARAHRELGLRRPVDRAEDAVPVTSRSTRSSPRAATRARHARDPQARDPLRRQDRVRAREEKLGTPAMRELERRVVLQVLDRRWRDHLYEMDYLKDGIGLRAMAQRDPLIEYQREGYQMFQAMMGQIKEESVGFLYNLDVEVRQQGEEVESEVRPRVCAGRRGAEAPVHGSRRGRRGRGAQRPRAGAAGGDVEAPPGRERRGPRSPRRKLRGVLSVSARTAPRHPLPLLRTAPSAAPREEVGRTVQQAAIGPDAAGIS